MPQKRRFTRTPRTSHAGLGKKCHPGPLPTPTGHYGRLAGPIIGSYPEKRQGQDDSADEVRRDMLAGIDKPFCDVVGEPRFFTRLLFFLRVNVLRPPVGAEPPCPSAD